MEHRELFLDSANIEEIEELIQTPVISGVTTNPSLVAKEKKIPYLTHLQEIRACISLLSCPESRYRHFSVEVLGVRDDVIREAQLYYRTLNDSLKVSVAVKIPISGKTRARCRRELRFILLQQNSGWSGRPMQGDRRLSKLSEESRR
jgi:hypothetical protein